MIAISIPMEKYRVMQDARNIYAGDDIDAAISVFGTAVSRRLHERPDAPDCKVRLMVDTHSVVPGLPVLSAYILDNAETTEPRLAAVLYGVTIREWQRHAPAPVTGAFH